MMAFVPNVYKLIIFVFFFFVSFSVYSENTRIGVFTDKPFYNPDEIPKIFVSGVNREFESRIVDVHVGLIDPNGRIYEYPDWNTTLSPWISLLELPAGFEFPAALVADATNFPGGITPGLWHAGVALTIPGTFEFVSVQVVPFSMLLPANGEERKFGKVLLVLDTDSVILQGGFLSLSGDFNDLVGFINGPQTEVEQCSLKALRAEVSDFVEPELNVSFLDAGSNFFVTANSGVEQRLFEIDPLSFKNYFTDPSPPIEFYQAGETYTLTSLGGTDIGPFNASVTAPRPIIVSQPNIAEPLIIDSNQNLNLQWNGNDGIGEVVVTLFGLNLTTDSYLIKCRFADDGFATVPATLLRQLEELTSDSFFLPELSFGRTAIEQFSKPEERLDYGFFEIRAATSTLFNFAE